MRQTFGDNGYEIIVVSDGPDPLTQAMIERTNASNLKLRYLVLPEKKGPAAARNLGWLAASGKIIAFTDDDCLPDRDWLRTIVSNIKTDQVAAVSGRIIVPSGQNPTDHQLNTAGLETAEFVTANCACTKAALIAAGGFDERFHMAWREDSDLHFKLLGQHIPITYLAHAIVVHPVRKAGWGSSLKEQKKTLFNALLYQKYPEMYRERIQPLPPVLYYLIVAGFLVMVTGMLGNIGLLFVSGLIIWATLTAYFIFKRLWQTSHAVGHVTEMALTSILIPFLSIYWQWYGAIKYRVLFI